VFPLLIQCACRTDGRTSLLDHAGLASAHKSGCPIVSNPKSSMSVTAVTSGRL
jgi:hypothetical protein